MTGRTARLRSLGGDVLVYGVATTVVRAMSLLMTPIVTRAVAPDEYGLADAGAVLLVLGGSWSLFGQDSAMARYYVEADTDEARRRIVASALLVSGGLAVATGLCLWLLARPLAMRWLGDERAVDVFRLVAVAIPLYVASQQFIALLKWTRQRTRFVILTLTTAGLTLVCTVLFVQQWRLSAWGVLAAQTAANGVAAVLGFAICRPLVGLAPGRDTIRRLVRFGWPFMILAVGSVLMVSLDRAFIGGRLSVADLGLYAAAVKAAGLMALVVGAFQIAWGPFAFALFRDPDANATFNAVLLLYAAAMLLLTLALSTFSVPVLYVLASREFTGAHAVVGILALAMTVNGLQWVTSIGILAAEKSHLTAVGYVVALLAGVLVFYPLAIGWWGSFGAGVATLAVQVVSTVLVTWIAQRVHHYAYDLGTTTAMVVAAAVCILWQSRLTAAHTPEDWLLRIGIGLAGAGTVGLLALRTPALGGIEGLRRLAFAGRAHGI